MSSYLNVTRLLSRKVFLDFGTPDQRIDESWAADMRQRILAYVRFLSENGMLKVPLAVSDKDIDKVVIDTNDLTERGLRFAQSNALGRWLDGFDRNPAKSPQDIRLLIKQSGKS